MLIQTIPRGKECYFELVKMVQHVVILKDFWECKIPKL
jgi:hypothetical protein